MNPTVYYTRLSSPVGPLSVFATNKGVKRLCFGEKGFRHLLQKIAISSGAPPVQDDTMLLDTAEALKEYFLGRNRRFQVRVDLSGLTPFQTRVLRTLQRIPYGSVRSYQWVAQSIGNPGASRAVGQACAVNPIPLLIPCHRVIAKDGSLGGFSAGTDIKQWLLDLESRGP